MNENGTEFKPIEKTVRATLATLRENAGTGWKRLVTVTQWGSGKFKLDIRDWNSDMSKANKGMTFSRSEAEKLRNVLSILDLSIIDEYKGTELDQSDNKSSSALKEAV